MEFADAPLTTVMELTDKRDGSERVLHWVNFQLGIPVAPAPEVYNVAVVHLR